MLLQVASEMTAQFDYNRFGNCDKLNPLTNQEETIDFFVKEFSREIFLTEMWFNHYQLKRLHTTSEAGHVVNLLNSKIFHRRREKSRVSLLPRTI